MSDTVLTSLTACLLTLAMVLMSARYRPQLAIRWLRLPARMAIPVSALLISAAGLSALPVEGDQRHLANGIPAVQVSADPQPSATGPDSLDLGMTGAARERAVEHLRDYANRIAKKTQSIAAIGSDAAKRQDAAALPDVETMLARLVERLKSDPGDVKGWTTLGWAYSNTGRMGDAASAYERALALEPGSAELKSALAEARSKAAGSAGPNGAEAPQNTAMPAADNSKK